nr:reverse transcriptase domain-containing protein [Tanacetum cinerariifolium]
MVRDIAETFQTLRKINMKLNPKKCSFGLAEGVFLGYVITPEGMKPCPDKTSVVLQLPSPQTIKEVQSLNEKLASLNRLNSRGALAKLKEDLRMFDKAIDKVRTVVSPGNESSVLAVATSPRLGDMMTYSITPRPGHLSNNGSRPDPYTVLTLGHGPIWQTYRTSG